jgi:hypothetical protein
VIEPWHLGPIEVPDGCDRADKQSVWDVCTAAITRDCDVPPLVARAAAYKLIGDLFGAGYTVADDDGHKLFVWAWLKEHGLDASLGDVRDPAFRVTLDIEAG